MRGDIPTKWYKSLEEARWKIRDFSLLSHIVFTVIV